MLKIRTPRVPVRLLDVLNVLGIGVLAVIFLQFVAPYHMDEFNQFHPITCAYYGGNAENVFRESCRQYALDLFGLGVVLPLLAYPFLILSIAWTMRALLAHDSQRWLHALRRGTGIAWIGAMVAFNLVLWATFSLQPIRPSDHPSKLLVHEMLSDHALARRYLTVVIDWGMYYYQGLYGDRDQSVIYVEPLQTAGQLSAVRAVAERTGRKLLFVFNAEDGISNIPLIRSSLRVGRCTAVPRDGAWQVIAEPSNVDDACRPERTDPIAQVLP